MAKFHTEITVADEAALKALSPIDGFLTIVTTPSGSVALPPALYKYDISATYTEQKPAIITPTSGTGRWIMMDNPVVISSNDPSGTPPFADILWRKLNENTTWLSKQIDGSLVWFPENPSIIELLYLSENYA